MRSLQNSKYLEGVGERPATWHLFLLQGTFRGWLLWLKSSKETGGA